jgi:hypothetical protein
MTVQALADCVGCSRQSASKFLGRFEARRLIIRNGRRITLTRAVLETRPRDS